MTYKYMGDKDTGKKPSVVGKPYIPSCLFINTKDMYEELKSKYIGNDEYAKDRTISRAEKLAIIKVMQGCCCNKE